MKIFITILFLSIGISSVYSQGDTSLYQRVLLLEKNEHNNEKGIELNMTKFPYSVNGIAMNFQIVDVKKEEEIQRKYYLCSFVQKVEGFPLPFEGELKWGNGEQFLISNIK